MTKRKIRRRPSTVFFILIKKFKYSNNQKNCRIERRHKSNTEVHLMLQSK